jgi:hypothetical protein
MSLMKRITAPLVAQLALRYSWIWGTTYIPYPSSRYSYHNSQCIPNGHTTSASRHCHAPLSCTMIPLPLHEFTPSPIAVAASLVASSRPLHGYVVHRNDGITVTFSTDPFGPSFPETISVSGIHQSLGLELRHAMDRQRCQLVAMTPGTPSHR